MKVSHSLEKLLTSRTRLKLLNILFYSPTSIYYVRELVRLTGEEINSVRRELANLSTINVVSSESRGNRLFYWANPNHYMFYQLIVLANKHAGLGAKIHENQLKLGKVRCLFYSQEFLFDRHLPSPNIDVLVIGDIFLRQVEEFIKTEEASIGREINYMVMDIDEFQLRLNKRDPIMVDFFLNYPALIVGNQRNLFK